MFRRLVARVPPALLVTAGFTIAGLLASLAWHSAVGLGKGGDELHDALQDFESALFTGTAALVLYLGLHRRDRALRRAERGYERLFERNLAGVYRTTLDGKILEANAALASILGYASRAELLRSSPAKHYARPEDREIFLEALRREGSLPNYEHRLLRRDGSIADVLESAALVPAEDGSGEVIEGTIIDLTPRAEAERALRDSERHHRNLLDVLPDAVMVQSGGIFTYVNPAAAALFGAPGPAALVGTPIIERVHPDDRERVRQRVKKLTEEGRQAPFLEERFLRLDGSSVEVEVAAVPIREGARQGVQVVARDVGERRRAEGARREQERALQSLMANLPGMAYRCRNDSNWTMEFMSEGVLGLTGHPSSDFVDNRVLSYNDVIHPDDQAAVWDKVQAAVARREPYLLDYRIRSKDGTERWVWERGLGIFDGDGSLRFLEGFIADVTELHRAQEKLRTLEERARLMALMLDVAPVSATVFDVDGRQLYANQRAAELHGYALADFCKLTLADIHSQGRRASLRENSNAVLASGERRFECEHLRRDGTLVPLEILAMQVDWGGQRAILSLGVDITARRETEAAMRQNERRLFHAQKLESLGVLAGGIAHDFNNLLLAVLANLDLAGHDLPQGSPARPAIDEAVKAARRGAGLSRQMLAYSGRGHFQMRALDLSALVEENAQMLRVGLAKTTSLELHLGSGLPPVVADAAQMQQVVMNLLTNASEALEGRPGTVRLKTGVRAFSEAELAESRLAEKPRAGTFVYVEVSDTGCGMDEATLSRLFDPFFSTKATGRGLGLAAVLGIARGHEGAITVESAPGQGASFRVLLPASSGTVDADEARVGTRLASASPLSLARILVVDDEEPVRVALRRLLARLGCEPILAGSGEEALRIFGEQPGIDLVLLDLTMPGLDGAATFREMARIRPEVRAVLSSGYAEEDVAAQYSDLGVAGFLEKPYSLDRLRRVLEAALRG